MKASAGKWIEYGNGSVTWGKLVFLLCPPPLLFYPPPVMSRLGSERGVEGRGVSHGAGGGQYQHMILHHCFSLPPAEPQLVVSMLAKLLCRFTQQAGSDLCMRLPGRGSEGQAQTRLCS